MKKLNKLGKSLAKPFKWIWKQILNSYKWIVKQFTHKIPEKPFAETLQFRADTEAKAKKEHKENVVKANEVFKSFPAAHEFEVTEKRLKKARCSHTRKRTLCYSVLQTTTEKYGICYSRSYLSPEAIGQAKR